MGKQTMRQAARLAVSQVQAKRRHERAERDRRLEKPAIGVLTALGERDGTIAATEQRAGAALQAMITDERLTVAEAVQWCADAISHRAAGRLRLLTGQPDDNRARGSQQLCRQHPMSPPRPRLWIRALSGF
jgi:hypothetical protein